MNEVLLYVYVINETTSISFPQQTNTASAIGAASITSNTRFWLERLRQRWYAPSTAAEQATSHCIVMKSATSARPSLAAFNLSFDLLALVGRVEDDGGHRFVLSAAELDLFQRELANAQMESGHIASNVAMTSATSASVALAPRRRTWRLWRHHPPKSIPTPIPTRGSASPQMISTQIAPRIQWVLVHQIRINLCCVGKLL